MDFCVQKIKYYTFIHHKIYNRPIFMLQLNFKPLINFPLELSMPCRLYISNVVGRYQMTLVVSIEWSLLLKPL